LSDGEIGGTKCTPLVPSVRRGGAGCGSIPFPFVFVAVFACRTICAPGVEAATRFALKHPTKTTVMPRFSICGWRAIPKRKSRRRAL
jgi:hypothetical protein